MSDNAQEQTTVKSEIEKLETKLQDLRDEAAGVKRMPRAEWDQLATSQQVALSSSIKKRELVLTD